VVSIETDRGARLAEGLVKQLTGGDPVRARLLYSNSFEFHPEFKLFLAANDRPRTRDDDDAIWRRIVELPFAHTVPEGERDPAVRLELSDPAKSGAAILAWAVEGCLDWQRNGLVVPEVVKASTEAYRESQNPLSEFIQERCVLEADAWTPSANLLAAYEAWAQSQGTRRLLGPKSFGDKLRALGLEPGRHCPRPGAPQARGWVGVRLIGQTEDV